MQFFTALVTVQVNWTSTGITIITLLLLEIAPPNLTIANALATPTSVPNIS